jgi:1-acyl-sn-glycerol-3-phosphate acyltransferase
LDLWGWILVLGLVLCWAGFSSWVLRNPRGDPVVGLLYRAAQIYSRAVHRVRYEGREHIPPGRRPGPLIIVCNHTAGIDPILVQAGVEFEVRWMMATDMRVPHLEDLLALADVIDVDRQGRDTTSARRAVRHLREGGVLGVFPEGGIEKPSGRLRPFFAGVGLIVVRSGAPVLPVWISGTPEADHAWQSFWKGSRARVRFGPVMRPAGRTPEEVTRAIRAWFERESGWPDA